MVHISYFFLFFPFFSIFFQGNDVAARIFQKKELGCHASGFVTIEEGQRKDLSLREKEFLDLLGANKDIKSIIMYVLHIFIFIHTLLHSHTSHWCSN